MFVYDSFDTLHTHKAQIERLRALTSFAFGLVKQGPIFMNCFFWFFRTPLSENDEKQTDALLHTRVASREKDDVIREDALPLALCAFTRKLNPKTRRALGYGGRDARSVHHPHRSSSIKYK